MSREKRDRYAVIKGEGSHIIIERGREINILFFSIHGNTLKEIVKRESAEKTYG